MTARRWTALHEAGHGVAEVVLGGAGKYVSIRPGKTFSGIHVSVPSERDTSQFNPFKPLITQPAELRADIEREVIVYLAGDLAAATLYEPSGDESEAIEAPDTDALARQALASLGPRLAELIVADEESDEPHEDDETRAHELASAFVSIGDDTMSGAFYLEWLRGEARALVLRYRAAILRVADALERHVVLQGEQVAALVYPPKRR